MRTKLNMLVTAPVLGAALVSLVRDESLESFIKKVLLTWVFFSIVHAFVTAMWRIATPAPGEAPERGTAQPDGAGGSVPSGEARPNSDPAGAVAAP